MSFSFRVFFCVFFFVFSFFPFGRSWPSPHHSKAGPGNSNFAFLYSWVGLARLPSKAWPGLPSYPIQLGLAFPFLSIWLGPGLPLCLFWACPSPPPFFGRSWPSPSFVFFGSGLALIEPSRSPSTAAPGLLLFWQVLASSILSGGDWKLRFCLPLLLGRAWPPFPLGLGLRIVLSWARPGLPSPFLFWVVLNSPRLSLVWC